METTGSITAQNRAIQQGWRTIQHTARTHLRRQWEGTLLSSAWMRQGRSGRYTKAIWFYERALEIFQRTLPPNHILLATSYNNIGEVHYKMVEYFKALSFYEKAFKIYQKTLPPNHPVLGICYNNIGLAYKNIREYSKALSFFEIVLVTRQKTLPTNHPDVATTYSNIGATYMYMGQYSRALLCLVRALDIF